MDDPFYKAAINFLSYRSRSIKEVIDYLRKKKAPENNVTAIVSLLQKQHFLDDTAFARAWIHARTSGKPKSKNFIIRELKEKGVTEETIYTAFEDLAGEIQSDFDQAVRLLSKKTKQYSMLEKDALYRKAGGYLARRGFSYEVIRKSIDQVFGK